MLKRTTFLLVFFVSACVTVNIYFPAAAVERAAEQIVKETWGEPSKTAPPPAPQSKNRFSPWQLVALSLVSEAHAQEADINVSNPAIRAIKDSIKARSDAIKPFMDRGNIGIAADGLLAIRNTDGLNLKERAETTSQVKASRRSKQFSPKAGSNKRVPAGGSRIARVTGRKSNETANETSYSFGGGTHD